LSSGQPPYLAVGGRDGVRAIVDRFYDLMDSSAAYRDLREMHAQDLTPMRDSLSGFLCGWLGGDTDWFAANPGKCMMSLHARFPINAAVADQWTSAMRQAMADCGIEGETASRINDALGAMASAMVRA
jgi:hemoglobin